MTDELKPIRCGCGGEGKTSATLVDFLGKDMRYSIRCEDCGIMTNFYHTETEAVTAWNRAMGTDVQTLMKVFAYDATCAVCEKKKERTAKVDVDDGDYYCGNCAQELGASYRYCPTCGATLEWE